jgi:hypothetical protein
MIDDGIDMRMTKYESARVAGCKLHAIQYGLIDAPGIARDNTSVLSLQLRRAMSPTPDDCFKVALGRRVNGQVHYATPQSSPRPPMTPPGSPPRVSG